MSGSGDAVVGCLGAETAPLTAFRRHGMNDPRGAVFGPPFSIPARRVRAFP